MVLNHIKLLLVFLEVFDLVTLNCRKYYIMDACKLHMQHAAYMYFISNGGLIIFTLNMGLRVKHSQRYVMTDGHLSSLGAKLLLGLNTRTLLQHTGAGLLI